MLVEIHAYSSMKHHSLSSCVHGKGNCYSLNTRLCVPTFILITAANSKVSVTSGNKACLQYATSHSKE